jgi:hypothetical protein
MLSSLKIVVLNSETEPLLRYLTLPGNQQFVNLNLIFAPLWPFPAVSKIIIYAATVCLQKRSAG